ncbi:hypothetical protein [Escherichia coli]|uniref:hypothetical protein n=1 Tax=Escherichia coli TaxID=562 RepID=UPI0022563F99|nr:hypothetical protein [Escherichia coli]MCX3189134.1 hypothetical protein [Escherichia coli]
MSKSIWQKKSRIKPETPINIIEAGELLGVSSSTLIAYHRESRIHLYARLEHVPVSFGGYLSPELLEAKGAEIGRALFLGCAPNGEPHPLGLRLSKVSCEPPFHEEVDCFWCAGMASGYWGIPASFPINPNEPITLNRDAIHNYLFVMDDLPDGVESLNATFTGETPLTLSMNEIYVSPEDIERVYEAAKGNQQLKSIGDNTDGRSRRYEKIHENRREIAAYVLEHRTDKCRGVKGFSRRATVIAISMRASEVGVEVKLPNIEARYQDLEKRLGEWFPDKFPPRGKKS